MKTLIVVCTVLAYASAGTIQWAATPLSAAWNWAGAAPLAAGWPLTYAPLWAKSQYHSQDELGRAAFGHAQLDQAHNAVRDAAGNVVGRYSYVDPNGKIVVTEYVADGLGFRVASNALPEGPGEGPVPVEDTPEVVAARAAHLAEVAAARAAKIVPEVINVAPAPVQDTPEVIAARAAHLAEVEAVRSRNKRGVIATVPIVQDSIISPITYTSAITSPIVSSLALNAPVIAAPSAIVREATLTRIVNTPGHAESYRVD